MRQFRVVLEWEGEPGLENEQKNSRLAALIRDLLRTHDPEEEVKLRFFLETGPRLEERL